MAEKNKSEDPSKSDLPRQGSGSDSPTPLGEIEQGPSKFEQFLENNQKLLIIVSLLAIVGLASYIIVKGVREAHAVSAGEALVSSKDLGDFRNVIKDFEGTPAAGTAQLELARKQWEDGLTDDALTTLRDFIEANPDHAAQPSARMTLASYLLSDGQGEDEAVGLLNGLAEGEKSAHLAGVALVRLGDLHNANGDQDAAREAYERASNPEFKNSVLTESLIQSRLNGLGVAPPVTVPRPAPTPATPPLRAPLLPADAPDNTAPAPAPAPEPAPAPAPEPAPAPAPEPAPAPAPEPAPAPAPEPAPAP